MGNKAIDFLNVSFSFNDTQDVLNDINLSIQQSTITAVIGKSGSGKSTLLQLVNGMLRPTQGEVKLKGKPIDYQNIHEMRLQIGYVVQHIGLFPHLTISENIGILGRIGKRPKTAIDKRTRELMDMIGLPLHYLKKYPFELSGGEQQRVGLCRALLLNPPMVLMDEPFASLDFETKRSIYRYLLDIQKKEPRTVIMITHDWEETFALAEHFVWIENGSVKASGPISELSKLKDIYFSEIR